MGAFLTPFLFTQTWGLSQPSPCTHRHGDLPNLFPTYTDMGFFSTRPPAHTDRHKGLSNLYPQSCCHIYKGLTHECRHLLLLNISSSECEAPCWSPHFCSLQSDSCNGLSAANCVKSPLCGCHPSHGHLPHQRPGAVIPRVPPLSSHRAFTRIPQTAVGKSSVTSSSEWKSGPMAAAATAPTNDLWVGFSTQFNHPYRRPCSAQGSVTRWHWVCHHIAPHMCVQFISRHPLNNQPHAQIATTTTNSRVPHLGRF